jgi:hypothetical protein
MCSSIIGALVVPPGTVPHQGVRRVGHAVGAARAVAQDELDVLAGVELDHVVGRQLQRDTHDVVRQPLEPGHAHRHLADRESARIRHLARFKHHIAVRHAAAGQHVAGGFLVSRQGLGLMRSVHHGALDLLALAGTTGAVLAAVRQAYPGTDARGEDGFFGFGGETASAGPHGDGEGH